MYSRKCLNCHEQILLPSIFKLHDLLCVCKERHETRAMYIYSFHPHGTAEESHVSTPVATTALGTGRVCRTSMLSISGSTGYFLSNKVCTSWQAATNF